VRVKIISVFNGTGKDSKKPFRKVCAMLQTAKGQEYTEFFYDHEAAEPVEGKVYDVGVEAYSARDKMLQIRVAQLREHDAAAKPPLAKAAA
jgi:hypothetical protein